ncbi:hypothetical protein QO002_005908 [Pararhizobium capsulatum DSM 1112]|uniref:MOSC domain-containing protein n=1 Tax=Pararhizobium capsulatum DSM 1112 TaxID=1121113 RepID=A0ABU0BZL3_9HYPH|nr:hypothetical protein [Pararhizobium capsulatum]MDQ0323701.1 hypothetical protein [Pararhizobium capsulatum DSM 1112]
MTLDTDIGKLEPLASDQITRRPVGTSRAEYSKLVFAKTHLFLGFRWEFTRRLSCRRRIEGRGGLALGDLVHVGPEIDHTDVIIADVGQKST